MKIFKDYEQRIKILEGHIELLENSQNRDFIKLSDLEKRISEQDKKIEFMMENTHERNN